MNLTQFGQRLIRLSDLLKSRAKRNGGKYFNSNHQEDHKTLRRGDGLFRKLTEEVANDKRNNFILAANACHWEKESLVIK
jgi:hypothetical protein